jgi:hypothetical protein
MNFDQTRQTVTPRNLVYNVGVIKGWTSYIRKHPEIFDPKDVKAEPYMSRGCAILQDIFQGTPNDNTSHYTCDVADNLVADQIALYVPFAMQRSSARDRGVPEALLQIIAKLREEVVTT